jgi:ligand-binding sensor domain-containing protein
MKINFGDFKMNVATEINNGVLSIIEDKNGNYWFGNNGRGLLMYDGKRLTNVTDEQELSNSAFIKTGKPINGTLARVWAINEDDNGNLLLGTGEGELWLYDGNRFVNYKSVGVNSSGIEVIYKDKKGEILIGTNGDGVYKLNGNKPEKLKR